MEQFKVCDFCNASSSLALSHIGIFVSITIQISYSSNFMPSFIPLFYCYLGLPLHLNCPTYNPKNCLTNPAHFSMTTNHLSLYTLDCLCNISFDSLSFPDLLWIDWLLITSHNSYLPEHLAYDRNGLNAEPSYRPSSFQSFCTLIRCSSKGWCFSANSLHLTCYHLA